MTKTPLLVGNPHLLFERFYQDGLKQMAGIREEILKETGDDVFKSERTYGIGEAAELIGRSRPWLRENDPDVPKNDKGTGRWTLSRINAIRGAIQERKFRPEGSEPFIVSVFNYKGGVGKTTGAVHLAQRAALDGLRVLVNDLDPQGSCTYSLGGIIPDTDLKDSDVPADILLENPARFKEVIRSTYFSGVYLSPSSLLMQHLDLALPNSAVNNESEVGPAATRLATGLSEIKDSFDLIINDCPPNMGALVTNALVASNAIIVPVPPRAYDRASFVSLTNSLSYMYEQLGKPLDYLKILITQHGGSASENDQEKKIRALYGDAVLNNVVKHSAEISGASERMSSVYDLEKPLRGRDTHRRAIDMLNAVNKEILDDVKTIWEAQSGKR